jgi:hypothetical protein
MPNLHFHNTQRCLVVSPEEITQKSEGKSHALHGWQTVLSVDEPYEVTLRVRRLEEKKAPRDIWLWGETGVGVRRHTGNVRPAETTCADAEGLW